MKKITLCIGLALMMGSAKAQNGLENVIVEIYYVSDANDSIVSADQGGGTLPVGSVTYRIYADMLPGYKFQAAYGVPGHEMRIETSTLFFNNEDRGATSPTYSKTQAGNNTVMLDSWLSVGAACTNNFGILKSLDDGMATVSNGDGALQNNDLLAGIPLTTEDGLIAGTPEAVTAVGITTEIAVFDAQNDGTNGPLFSTSNGSWASLNGSVGPDTVDNKVLIAQITTNGTFSFELNIQIGTPTGGVENYVARDAVGAEIVIPSLIYQSSGVGIKHPDAKTGFTLNVFPNPTKDFFTLDISSPVKSTTNLYTIYDERGCVVYAKHLGVISGECTERVDISSFSKGQYFVELTMDGISSLRKLIIN